LKRKRNVRCSRIDIEVKQKKKKVISAMEEEEIDMFRIGV